MWSSHFRNSNRVELGTGLLDLDIGLALARHSSRRGWMDRIEVLSFELCFSSWHCWERIWYMLYGIWYMLYGNIWDMIWLPLSRLFALGYDMIWYMLAQRRRNFEMYRQNLDPQKLEDLAHDSHHHVSCLASRQAWPVCLFSWELWSNPSLLPGGVCLPPVSWHLWGQKAADGAHIMLQGGAPVCEVKGYNSYNSNPIAIGFIWFYADISIVAWGLQTN